MNQTNTLKTNITRQAQPAADQSHSFAKPAPRQWIKVAVIIALLVVGVLAAGAAYIWFSGGSGDASTAISAPALVLAPGDTRTRFSITPDESQVRFIIDEVLLNTPKTVVGSTNQVAGDLLVDFANPAHSQVGTVRINLRTLATDNDFRNRALRGQILQADRAEYEFASFTPTALLELPETVSVGQPLTFQMTGDLTVHGTTQAVSFDVTLLPVSDQRLEGTAQTTVRYQDFGMSIPEAPGVANVSDEVRLEIDFVAQAGAV